LKHSTLAARVVISDYDYIKPALSLVGSADVSADGTAEWSVYGDRVFSPEGAKRVATFRAESLVARKSVLSARGTQRHIRTGYRFELAEHPRLDREYLVISMSHIGRQLHGAPELDELLGSESNKSPEVYRIELEAIPSDVQYREPRHTPWPKIHGFENGVIDGAATSTYAQIDDHGRYATKLRFDEGPGKAGTASTWLRMAQPHGGGLEGFHFPLRKGTEVLVQFLDGDPDRPLIAAVLPKQPPQAVAAGNNTKNVMQTGGSTRTEIEDLAGGQYMHNTTPPQNTSMWMGTDATSKGGHNVEAASDGSAGRSFGSYFDRFIGGTKAEHVVDEVMRNYDANFMSTVTSNVEENYSANQDSTIISNVARNVVGALTDTVTGVVTRSWQSTATHHISDDVNETFQANHALQVKGTQDVHVLAKGDFTKPGGQGRDRQWCALEASPPRATSSRSSPTRAHVVANIGIGRRRGRALGSRHHSRRRHQRRHHRQPTVDAKSQSVSMIGSRSSLMSGGRRITGGEVSVKNSNITVAASADDGGGQAQPSLPLPAT
jgi:type VI secretion system secreted protein VgrG